MERMVILVFQVLKTNWPSNGNGPVQVGFSASTTRLTELPETVQGTLLYANGDIYSGRVLGEARVNQRD